MLPFNTPLDWIVINYLHVSNHYYLLCLSFLYAITLLHGDEWELCQWGLYPTECSKLANIWFKCFVNIPILLKKINTLFTVWFTAIFNLTNLSSSAGGLLWWRLIGGWRVAVTFHTLWLMDRHYINDRAVDKPVNSSWMQLLICICFSSIIYGLFKPVSQRSLTCKRT